MLLLKALEVTLLYFKENTEENNEDEGDGDKDNEATKHTRRTTQETNNSLFGFPFARIVSK